MNYSDSGVSIKKQLSDSTLRKLIIPGEHASATSSSPLEIPFAEDSEGNIERLILGFDRDYEDVNLLITGWAGSGKTTLLQTIIASASSNYKSEELQIWVDSRNWYEYLHLCKTFGSLTLITEHDTSYDKMSEFPAKISEEIDRRINILRASNEPNIMWYWNHAVENNYEPLPRILLIIDGLDGVYLSTGYEMNLERASRFGRAIGINVILASQSLLNLSQRITSFFNIRLALRSSHEDFRNAFNYSTDDLVKAVATVQSLSCGECYIAHNGESESLKKLKAIKVEYVTQE